MRHYTRLALTAAALLAAGSLTACSSDSTTSTPKEDSSSASAPAGAEGAKGGGKKEADTKVDVKITKSGVEDHEVWGPDAYVIHYTITNSGPAAADYYAELEVLDKDGDHLGQTGITADKLGPGKSKTGDTGVLDAEVQNGKLSDIASTRVSKVDRT